MSDSSPKIKVIDSSANAGYKLWKSLTENAGIKKNKLCLVSGRKVVPEVLRSWSSRIRTLIITDTADLKELDWPRRTEVVQLKKTLFADLDVSGTHYPLVVCETPEMATADLTLSPEGLELILALSDPNNLGAVLRSAEAFNVKKVILLSECANPFLPKTLRAAGGAVLRISLAAGPSIQKLPENMQCTGLDSSGQKLSDFQWPKNVRILLGEEGQGLPKNLMLQNKIAIPMARSLESLNATVAASIVLYKYFEKWS